MAKFFYKDFASGKYRQSKRTYKGLDAALTKHLNKTIEWSTGNCIGKYSLALVANLELSAVNEKNSKLKKRYPRQYLNYSTP